MPPMPSASAWARLLARGAAAAASDPSGGDDEFAFPGSSSVPTAPVAPLPWNDKPVIVSLLFVFLAFSLALLCMNSYTVWTMLQKQGPDRRLVGVSTTRARLNWLQLFGALMNVGNQLYFVISQTGRGLDCNALMTVGGVVYSSMVLSTSIVLIHRSTTLLRGKRRIAVRAFLYTVVSISTLLIVISNARRQFNQERLNRGACTGIWDRTFNAVGKGLLIVMYLGIIITFLRPLFMCVPHLRYGHRLMHRMVRHVRTIRKMSAGRTLDPQAQRLEGVVHTLFIKIITAITALALGTMLGLWGQFGDYFIVEFSIENTAAVYASTLAMERFRRDKKSSGSDEVDSTSHVDSGMTATKSIASPTSSTQVASRGMGIESEMMHLRALMNAGPSSSVGGGLAEPRPPPTAAAHPVVVAGIGSVNGMSLSGVTATDSLAYLPTTKPRPESAGSGLYIDPLAPQLTSLPIFFDHQQYAVPAPSYQPPELVDYYSLRPHVVLLPPIDVRRSSVCGPDAGYGYGEVSPHGVHIPVLPSAPMVQPLGRESDEQVLHRVCSGVWVTEDEDEDEDEDVDTGPWSPLPPAPESPPHPRRSRSQLEAFPPRTDGRPTESNGEPRFPHRTTPYS